VGIGPRLGVAHTGFCEQRALHAPTRACGIGLNSPPDTPIFVCTGVLRVFGKNDASSEESHSLVG
jgi:hypothetical protein